jgi:hypothetical protein
MHAVLRTAPGRRKCGLAVALILFGLAGCQEPPPRQFADFMEDPIAREGTLARCNRDREATEDDIECANARRAAAAIALIAEQERRAILEEESERRIAALRAEVERERAAAREAQAVAEAAARAAYDAQWRDGDGRQVVGVDGLPIAAGDEQTPPGAREFDGASDLDTTPRAITNSEFPADPAGAAAPLSP